MARPPNSRKEETHQRILDVAARAIRRQGSAGIGVADVMREAGLTHGGFYAHFESRDALVAEAIAHAGRDSFEAQRRGAQAHQARGASAFRALVETYLSPGHLALMETGCPVAALGCEIPRQSAAVRDALVQRVQGLIAAVQATLPAPSQAAASLVASTLVGSLQLARALGDNPEGHAVLAAARQALLAQYDLPAPAGH